MAGRDYLRRSSWLSTLNPLRRTQPSKATASFCATACARALLANGARRLDQRREGHRHTRRLQPIMHTCRANFAYGESTSLGEHFSLIRVVRQQVQDSINPGHRDLLPTLEGLHISVSNLGVAYGDRYRRLTAWEGSVGPPPRGFTATPAGGSKSGWHKWQ